MSVMWILTEEERNEREWLRHEVWQAERKLAEKRDALEEFERRIKAARGPICA